MIVGMDFGTTNSGMAVYDGHHIQFLPIDSASANSTIARTALYITNDRQVYIGRDAIDTYYAQNLNRPVSIQRVRVGEISLTFAELPTFIKDVYVDKDVLSPGRLFTSFKLGLSSLNYIGTVIGSHFYFLEDIIALYLYIARTRAEQHLGQEVKRIVLGRPVHFSLDPESDELARQRLLKAAFRAGYEEVCLQFEPIAAAYHYESTIKHQQNVLIFDFGGGTLDISVVRVGNPSQRKVLANGGVPIAGDVFDQKLVRARLPKHFGEGTMYQAGRQMLPVPSSFYEAFSNWQDILTLQKPDLFEEIKRIEQTAQRPLQLRALRNLVSSSYGMKMFDIVEGVKRQLSEGEFATIRLDGEGFRVTEPVTRREFERIIRPEINAIEKHLDAIMQDSGLRPEQIDVVIRTGGSSQIPAFVDVLEKRFGSQKVRSLDVFSSVTSGLGIIAHRIERGEIEATVHHRRDFDDHDRRDAIRNGIPTVDFDTLTRFISLKEEKPPDEHQIGTVALTCDHALVAKLHLADVLHGQSPLVSDFGDADHALALPADDKLLLYTSDYRFFMKTPRELAGLQSVGIDLADAEGLHSDAFGSEFICGLTPWDTLQPDRPVLLITTSGHFKLYAETLIPRLAQAVGYHAERMRGYPATLTSLPAEGDLTIFTSTGRAGRFSAQFLANIPAGTEGRLLKVSSTENIIAAYSDTLPAQFLLVSPDGGTARLDARDIPLINELSASPTKVFPRRVLKAVIPVSSNARPWLITTRRLLPVEDVSAGVRLKKGETAVGLLEVY